MALEKVDLDYDSFSDDSSLEVLEHDCGICIEPMKTLAFLQPPKEMDLREDALDSIDPECIRLKCGHAFHFSCQVPAMRMGKFCSLCRDELKPEAAVTQIRIGEDVWEFSQGAAENMETEINNIMQNNQDLKNALNTENNTNIDLQSIRAKMNDALNVHRRAANDLKKIRARFLREALKSFRTQHKDTFEESKSRIKNLLRMSKNLEDSILRRRGFTARQIHNFFSTDPAHDLNELVSNGAVGGDPARHRFWYR